MPAVFAESLQECEEYDQTSHAEQCEDEDEEVVGQKRRKKTLKLLKILLKACPHHWLKSENMQTHFTTVTCFNIQRI